MLDRLESPIGDVYILVHGARLCGLEFAGFEDRMDLLLKRRYGFWELKRRADPAGFTTRMHAYFQGDLNAVDDIPVEFQGTPFQEEVWTALRDIPVGKTESYGQLAARIGKPTASRAVGHANSQNPIGIVVPCHRVIGANSSLTGYAGGLERKRWLLEHERGVRRMF